MGLFDFVRDIGNRVLDKDGKQADEIRKYIESDNPGVENLKVEFDDGVATLSGECKDPAARQKCILMAGNILGVERIEADALSAPEDAEAEKAEYYVIQSGDTLWKIASERLGNGARYTEIFEANREVIKDPDKIFPGQKIRIPPA